MKLIFKILISFLLISAICLFLMSCGARKVKKEHSKEETKTELTDNSTIEKQSESNVKTTTTTKIDDKDESITIDETYEPVDNTKEASVIGPDGKKTILNNSKKTTKTETKKNNTQSESKTDIQETQKEAVKEQKAAKQSNTYKKENSVKNVEKKQYNPFNLIWIGSLVLLVIYIAYRIYKKLPLVPKF